MLTHTIPQSTLRVKFKTKKRNSEKCKAKIKYLIDRYKIAKDWNAKQSGGHLRKSILYDEIDAVLGCRDVVTLRHVAGSNVNTSTSPTSSSTGAESDNPTDSSVVDQRKERKRRKLAKESEVADEENDFLKKSLQEQKDQREEMGLFMRNFQEAQKQQLNTMNALVGALTDFLKKQ